MNKTPSITVGTLVRHQGRYIGKVNEIRHNIPNGRRYAFVQPTDPEIPERRLPVDELTIHAGGRHD